MTLSRSPSPVPGGGWSSPGLNINSGRASPSQSPGSPGLWDSAKIRNMSLNGSGHPSFSTHNQGFFQRHMRRISSSLPIFQNLPTAAHKDKTKPKRGRWSADNVPLVGRARLIVGRMGRKLKLRLLLTLVILLCIYVFYHSREYCSVWMQQDLLELTKDASSPRISLAEVESGRRGLQICNHPCRQRRRWCDGVEGRP